MASYPELTVHLELTDQVRGLVAENIDVALRVGARSSSGLISRVLRRPRWVTVVAPSYLARHVRPMHPRDLASCECVRFVDPRGRPVPWWFDGAQHEVTGTLLVNQGTLLLDAALAGVGVVQVSMMIGSSCAMRLLEIPDDMRRPDDPRGDHPRASAERERTRVPRLRGRGVRRSLTVNRRLMVRVRRGRR
jgi:hypothetical protein